MNRTFFSLALTLLIPLSVSYQGMAQDNPEAVPNPVLYFVRPESRTQPNGTKWTTYWYGVENYSAYPDSMFAESPSLPPCGRNSKASRTWVTLFDDRGRRLYGFCALRASSELNTISFSLPEQQAPPNWIYIEMTDRQTGIKYKSNLAKTTN